MKRGTFSRLLVITSWSSEFNPDHTIHLFPSLAECVDFPAKLKPYRAAGGRQWANERTIHNLPASGPNMQVEVIPSSISLYQKFRFLMRYVLDGPSILNLYVFLIFVQKYGDFPRATNSILKMSDASSF